MARKRMIDPSMWINEDFGTLSTLGKLVFIGLFSNADDEGRGKANPAFIKAVLFPYNDDLRIADIEKTLFEISSKMSVIFYSCNENKYYTLISWSNFQKIDKPKASQIPKYDENNPAIRRLFDEHSTTVRRHVVPNRIEKNRMEIEKNKNRNKKEFVPPKLEEVENYTKEKNLKVNAKDFFEYFEAGNWIDSKGKQVKNWKQKILTWNSFNESKEGQIGRNTKDSKSSRYKEIDLQQNRATKTRKEIDDSDLI